VDVVASQEVKHYPPADASEILSAGGGEIEVRFRGDEVLRPRHVVIERRGRLRRRPVAYWDGCAFKL